MATAGQTMRRLNCDVVHNKHSRELERHASQPGVVSQKQGIPCLSEFT